jgi:hypothetical protein
MMKQHRAYNSIFIIPCWTCDIIKDCGTPLPAGDTQAGNIEQGILNKEVENAGMKRDSSKASHAKQQNNGALLLHLNYSFAMKNPRVPTFPSIVNFRKKKNDSTVQIPGNISGDSTGK